MIFRKNRAFVNSSLLIVSAALISSVVAAELFYLFPALRKFPQPTGLYSIGTISHHWIDESRMESYSTNPDDKRELQVRFWYPTQKIAFQKEYPYLSDQQKDLIKKTYQNVHVPNFVWQSLLNVKSMVIPNAPCSTDKPSYPVIIFCHGAGSLPDLYSIYFTELASHGYIVVGINHSYISAGTSFPDGRTIIHKNIEKPLKNTIATMVVDVQFVLSKLQEMHNNGIPFFKKLDLKNIGILGHSMGGDTALEVCRIDERCKAGIDMDGWSIGTHDLQGFNKSFLFLLGQFGLLSTPMPTNKELHDMGVASQEEWSSAGIKGLHEIDQLCQNMPKYCRKVIVDNISHGEFSDTILLKKPLDKFIYPSWLRLQSPNPYESIKVMNQYILDFFDTYLKTN